MRAVLTMVYAMIFKNKLQITVFTVGCFLCSFLLLGALILNFAIEPSFDKAYERLDAPNVNISIGEVDVTEENLRLFMDGLPYVENYKISKCYLASNVKTPYENMEFSFLAASEGAAPDTGKTFANRGTHCVIGDQVEISINGKTAVFEVDSVIMDAVNSAPESMVPYFWIDEATLKGLTQEYEKGSWLIETNFVDDDVLNQFTLDYESRFGQPFDGDITSYEDIKRSYLLRYEIFSEFFIFLFLFLFVTVLAMTVLFSKMAVRSDMRNIGVLKSFGFTDNNITMIYVMRFLLPAIIAGIIGMFISGFILNLWLSGMFVNLDRSLFSIEGLIVYQLLVFLLVNVMLYPAVRLSIVKIVSASPIDAIHVRQIAKQKYLSDMFLPTPWFTQINLALIKCMGRKLETAFVFVLTLGMSLLFLTAFYIIDSVSNVHSHLEDWGIVEMDIYVSRKANADEEHSGLLRALEEDSAVDFYYAGLSDNITYKFEENGLTRNVVGEIYDKSIPVGLKFTFIEGRNPETANEAAIGINFAKRHNIGIGDRIYVLRNGEERAHSIVGIYPSFKEYGNSVRILTDDIKAFFGNQANGYYSIVLRDGEDINVFAKRMAREFPDFDFFPMERSNVHAVRMLLPTVATCLLLFALLFVLILLCLRKLMMIECKNDLTTYHFIGFSLRKMKAILRWRFDIPVFFGMLMAIPLSLYAMPIWMQPLAQQIGLSQIPIYPNGRLVVIALIVIFICSRIQPLLHFCCD